MKDQKDKLLELWIENSEAILDILSENEILKEIPLLNNIIGIWRIKISISDTILLNKIYKFLNNINPCPDSEIENLFKKYRWNKIWEQLLTLLESFEDYKKAELLWKCFYCFLKWHITKEDFFKFWYGIKKIYISDLNNLIHKNNLEQELLERLSLWGFSNIKRKNDNLPFQRYFFIEYELNKIWKKFKNVFL